MFEGQPKGLFALALANTGERFGYYTMLAVFALFLRANYGLSPAMAGTIYSSFLMLVYFLPLIGGIMADKFGFGKMVTTGTSSALARWSPRVSSSCLQVICCCRYPWEATALL